MHITFVTYNPKQPPAPGTKVMHKHGQVMAVNSANEQTVTCKWTTPNGLELSDVFHATDFTFVQQQANVL